MILAQKAFSPEIPNFEIRENHNPDFSNQNEFRTSCLI